MEANGALESCPACRKFIHGTAEDCAIRHVQRCNTLPCSLTRILFDLNQRHKNISPCMCNQQTEVTLSSPEFDDVVTRSQ